MSRSTVTKEVRGLLAEGRSHCDWGRPVRALPLMLRAAHLAPEDEEARHAVQTTRDEIRRLFAEVTRCEGTLAAHPTDGPALRALATALKRLDREDEAETVLVRALDANAADWKALLNLGHLLNDSMRFEEAIAVFERLSTVEPTLSLGWTFQGMALCNMQRAADALPVLEHALSLNPQDIGAWNQKVRALRMLGRDLEAGEVYQHERAARIASGVPQWMPRDRR
jgi:tetratricopeptide (TPR) repeat protein